MDIKPAPVMKNRASRALIFLTISVVILGGVLVMAYQRGRLTGIPKNTMPVTVVPTIDPNLWMKLTSSTGSSQLAQGEQVELNVVGSSSKKDIVGYDALINYDASYFDLISVKSLDPRFQAVPFKKEGMISITSTKSPSVNGQILLENSNLLSIILRPKKKGTTTVSIQAASGQERTKMVDTTSTVLLPQLTAITLAIY